MQGTRGYLMLNGIITHNPWNIENLPVFFVKSLILQWPQTQAQVTNTTHYMLEEERTRFLYVLSLSHLDFRFSAAISYKHTYATEGERDYW